MNPRQRDPWAGDVAVGLRIARLRVERGLTTREFSELAGIDNGYLSHIEKGRRAPTLPVMLSIASALGTTVLYLTTGSADGRCPFCGRDEPLHLL